MAGDSASRSPQESAWDPRLVASSWDFVARGYRDYWTPRFRPLVERAIVSLEPPGRGPIAVPGCGPGDEVLLLLKKFPARTIFATDPSREMMALCRESLGAARATTAHVTLGKAEDLSSLIHQAAGVLSCFTLQLLADPAAALQDWSLALRLGGVVSAVFWPEPTAELPFGRLMLALREVTQEARPAWEDFALKSLPRSGLEVLQNERVLAEMEHASPEELFDAIVHRGPLQVLLRRRGPDIIARVREAWLRSHGLERVGAGWKNRVEARLWVLRKVAEPGGEEH